MRLGTASETPVVVLRHFFRDSGPASENRHRRPIYQRRRVGTTSCLTVINYRMRLLPVRNLAEIVDRQMNEFEKDHRHQDPKDPGTRLRLTR